MRRDYVALGQWPGPWNSGLKQRRWEIFWMRRSKSYALNTWHISDRDQQLSKIPCTGSIGIYILPQQGNLSNPLASQTLGFFKNAFRVSGTFSSSGIGDHAERTKIVTPTHNGDPTVHPAISIRNDPGIRFIFG